MESVIGRFAWSIAGRDKGRLFIIIAMSDESHVMVADGELRRVDRPKKKKLRHLVVTEKSAESVAETYRNRRKPLDADLREAVRQASAADESV